MANGTHSIGKHGRRIWNPDQNHCAHCLGGQAPPGYDGEKRIWFCSQECRRQYEADTDDKRRAERRRTGDDYEYWFDADKRKRPNRIADRQPCQCGGDHPPPPEDGEWGACSCPSWCRDPAAPKCPSADCGFCTNCCCTNGNCTDDEADEGLPLFAEK